jgi:NADH:ubiquinone oxidoreductase subunit 4 (subunit M)
LHGWFSFRCISLPSSVGIDVLFVVGEFSVLFAYLAFFFLFILIFGYDNLILLPVIIMLCMLDLYGFIWVELIVFPLYFMLVKSGSSFERVGSWYYLFFYRIVLRFLLLNSLSRLLFLAVSVIVVLAKYPVAGLHFWLPKVHVEASLIGSMVLARLILKVAFILSWGLNVLFIFMLLVLLYLTLLIVLGFDGKVVMAYSSVVHMSVGCVVFVLVSVVGVYCGLVHVVVSPLMFFICYFSYNLVGSRSIKGLLGGYIVLFLFLVNISFPPFGAFMSEV